MTVTLTPIAERLAGELSLSVFYDLSLSRMGFEHPTLRLRSKRSNLLRHLRDETFIKFNLMQLSLCI